MLCRSFGWGLIKTYAVAIVIIIAVTLLTFKDADAGEPSAKLKEATAHLMNGSGFVIKAPSGKTYLTTNGHVCLQGSWQGNLEGSLESGRVLRGKIVKRSMVADLCAAYLGERDLAPLSLAPDLKPRQQVYTRGYPFGVLSQSAGQYVGIMKWSYMFPIEQIGECTKPFKKEYGGTETVVGCVLNYTDNLTNLYARPGSSGSPVVNEQGDLVGVMSSWDSGRDAGGMVRLEDVKEFFKGL